MAVGPWQIAIIACVLVLLFGGRRFATLGKSLAEGITGFRRVLKSIEDDVEPEHRPRRRRA